MRFKSARLAARTLRVTCASCKVAKSGRCNTSKRSTQSRCVLKLPTFQVRNFKPFPFPGVSAR
eukprot:6077644-Alexandrium_andersonii.AAC.1